MTSFDKLLLCGCTATMIVLGWISGPFHNPDANSYYGVVLRLIEGNFRGSVDGIVGPLLSWLMTIPVLLGLDLHNAYRSVQIVVFGFFLYRTLQIFTIIGIASLPRILAVVATVAQLIYFTIFLVTADLLFATCVLSALIHLLRVDYFESRRAPVMAGLYGGLAYLAKPMGIPICLAIILLLSVREYLYSKPALRAALTATALAYGSMICVVLPWITVLSMKYSIVNIGIHPYIHAGYVSEREYTIDTPIGQIVRAAENGAFPDSIENEWWSILVNTGSYLLFKIPVRITSSVDSLRPQIAQLFGINYNASLYGLLLCLASFTLFRSNRSRYRERSLWLAGATYVLVHLSVWGGQLRYFLVLLPICHGLVFGNLCSWGWQHLMPHKALSSLNGRLRLTLTLLSLICIMGGIVTNSYWSTIYSSATLKIKLVEYCQSHPLLSGHRGPMTGRLDERHSGYIAGVLKRRVPNVIDTQTSESSKALERALSIWKITQVLWFGAPPSELDKLEWLERSGPYLNSGVEIYIYTKAPSPEEQ